MARPGRVSTCIPSWQVYGCFCPPAPGADRRVHTVAAGCRKKDCATCWSALVRRKGAALEERLRVTGRPFVYVVGTVPPALRPRMADPKAWRKAVRRFWHELKALGMVCAFEASHPRGDCPKCKAEKVPEFQKCNGCVFPLPFHPHVNMVCIPKDPKAGHWIDHQDVRAAWGRALGLVSVAPSDLVVHVSYARPSSPKFEGKLRKLAAYVPRPFPGWSWWTGSGRWYGDYPRKAKMETEDGKKAGAVWTWCGEVLDLVPNREAPTCDECGAVLKYLGRVSADDFERAWLAHTHWGTTYPWERSGWKPGGRGFTEEVSEDG